MGTISDDKRRRVPRVRGPQTRESRARTLAFQLFQITGDSDFIVEQAIAAPTRTTEPKREEDD